MRSKHSSPAIAIVESVASVGTPYCAVLPGVAGPVGFHPPFSQAGPLSQLSSFDGGEDLRGGEKGGAQVK